MERGRHIRLSCQDLLCFERNILYGRHFEPSLRPVRRAVEQAENTNLSSSTMKFVGRGTDRAAAIEMYRYL